MSKQKEKRLSTSEAIIPITLPGRQPQDFLVSAPISCTGIREYFEKAIEFSLSDGDVLKRFTQTLDLFEANGIETKIFFDNDFIFSDNTDYWPIYLKGVYDNCNVMIRLDEKKGQVWHALEWRRDSIDFQYEEVDECIHDIRKLSMRKNRKVVVQEA